MQELFELVLEQMELGTVDSMVQTGLALHEMFALCAQSLFAQAEMTTNRQLILQAAETLRKNYRQELSLADLLSSAHMSKSYFLRLFRRYMGTTPYNYLVNFRITQAKELLVLTDHSISEIAQEAGFGDASNFSTRFAKHRPEPDAVSEEHIKEQRIQVKTQLAFPCKIWYIHYTKNSLE